MAELVTNDLYISVECAKQLHLNMLIYKIGLCTIFSVSSPGIPIEEIFLQQKKLGRIAFCVGGKHFIALVDLTTEKEQIMVKMISSYYDISDKKYIEPILQYMKK